jgi:carbohydrate-selective porin OprB
MPTKNESEKAAETWATENGWNVNNSDKWVAKVSFLAGWNERDKQPISLSMAQVGALYAAAINAPSERGIAEFGRVFEAVLNAK